MGKKSKNQPKKRILKHPIRWALFVLVLVVSLTIGITAYEKHQQVRHDRNRILQAKQVVDGSIKDISISNKEYTIEDKSACYINMPDYFGSPKNYNCVIEYEMTKSVTDNEDIAQAVGAWYKNAKKTFVHIGREPSLSIEALEQKLQSDAYITDEGIVDSTLFSPTSEVDGCFFETALRKSVEYKITISMECYRVTQEPHFEPIIQRGGVGY